MKKLPIELIEYAKLIISLHENWNPHAGQIPIGRAIFNDKKEVVFVQCGRKFGKTEILCYILIRYALEKANLACYYISPYQKQSREILWASKRLQNFIPRHYIKDINNTEMRITLTNGSFIKLDGSDNYEAYRGITPSMVAYDEFKDFRPEFHIAMEPNLAAKKAPLIILGTPPSYECQFTELADECKKDPSKAFFEAPTESNPHIDKHWLEKTKQTLIDRGEAHVWEREYMGRFVKGGPSHIFPMFDRKKFRMPLVEMYNRMDKSLKKLHWYCIADPGTTSVFGVLFAAINPRNNDIYILDEIYETEHAKTSVTNIGRRIIERESELDKDTMQSWYECADEAAAWFINEMIDRYGKSFAPTQKHAIQKEHGLSLIKDIFLKNKIFISERCTNLFYELENYVVDKNGRIVKADDHLLDCLRYLLWVSNYQLESKFDPKFEDELYEHRNPKIIFQKERERAELYIDAPSVWSDW